MKRKNKTSLIDRSSDILRGNEGASIVLVTIIAVIIITCIVILRVSLSTVMANSAKQYNQDQAYIMANSMGATIDSLIQDKTLVLTNYNDVNGTTILTDTPSEIPNASIEAKVTPSGSGYIVTVEAQVAAATYVYTAYYSRAGNTNNFMRQLL